MSRCPDHRSLEFQIQWFRSRSLPPDVRQFFGILFFLRPWPGAEISQTKHSNDTYKMEKAFQAIFTSQIKSLHTKSVWGIGTCCFACQTKRSLRSFRAPNIWISIWSCLKIWIPQDPGQLSIPQRKHDRFWVFLPSDQHILKLFWDENPWHHCHYFRSFPRSPGIIPSWQTNPGGLPLLAYNTSTHQPLPRGKFRLDHVKLTRNIFSGWISAAGSDVWTRDMPLFLMEQRITFGGKFTADLSSPVGKKFQYWLDGLESFLLPPKYQWQLALPKIMFCHLEK